MNPRSLPGLTLASLLATGVVHAQAAQIGDELELRFKARAQYDFLINSDAPDTQTLGGDFRRVRVGFRARYADDWIFTASSDFPDEVRLRDLSLEYRGLPVRIEVGRFQEPFGLAEYGSSKHTLFMERPSPSSLGPDYGLGAALNYRGAIWGVTVGAFAANDSPQLGGDRNERALTGRVNLTPLRGRHLLHTGVSASQRKREASNGLQLAGSGETILVRGLTPRSPRDLVESDYRLLGGELAYRFRSLLLQAEWIDLASDGRVNGHGTYVEVGYLLTGEKRPYSTRQGAFGGVQPKRPVTRGGWGALELGARYGLTDFSDNGGDRGSVYGLALNWYPIEQARLSLNAQQVTLREAGAPEEDTRVVQGRVQVFF